MDPEIRLTLSPEYLPSQGATLSPALSPPQLLSTTVLDITLEMGLRVSRRDDWARIRDFLSFFGIKPQAPNLNSLILSTTRSTPDTILPESGLFAEGTPIQNVRLVNWNINWNSAIPPSFKDVIHLAIVLDQPQIHTKNHVARASSHEILSTLALLPELRSLELQRVFGKLSSGGDGSSQQAPRWTKLERLHLLDHYDAASVVFNQVAYPASAQISVFGLQKTEVKTGLEDNRSLFRKMTQRAGGRIHVLKIERTPGEDAYSLSAWAKTSQLANMSIPEMVTCIPPRIKLEGPSTQSEILACLMTTPLDQVEHAVIANLPLTKPNWKKFGCLECLKSLHVIGDDLDLLQVFRDMPPLGPGQGTSSGDVFFSKLDYLHLENWALDLPTPVFTGSSSSVIPPPAFTSQGTAANFNDLDTIIRARIDRGYGPKRLNISPVEGPLQERIRSLMDLCNMSSLFDWERLDVRDE